MSGSRRWFQYESDTTLAYAVELDESNAELTGFGFAPLVAGPAGPVANGRVLKVTGNRPLSMRYVNAVAQDADSRTVRRRFYVGTNAAAIWQGNTTTFTADGLNFSVSSFIGENRVVVPQTDTARIDGDVDANFAAGP